MDNDDADDDWLWGLLFRLEKRNSDHGALRELEKAQACERWTSTYTQYRRLPHTRIFVHSHSGLVKIRHVTS